MQRLPHAQSDSLAICVTHSCSNGTHSSAYGGTNGSAQCSSHSAADITTDQISNDELTHNFSDTITDTVAHTLRHGRVYLYDRQRCLECTLQQR